MTTIDTNRCQYVSYSNDLLLGGQLSIRSLSQLADPAILASLMIADCCDFAIGRCHPIQEIIQRILKSGNLLAIRQFLKSQFELVHTALEMTELLCKRGVKPFVLLQECGIKPCFERFEIRFGSGWIVVRHANSSMRANRKLVKLITTHSARCAILILTRGEDRRTYISYFNIERILIWEDN
jgi:hypothetical protein